MRAKLKSKQTMEMAIANTQADFLLSFTQLKDHQVAPVSNWGIAILKQMTADIMSCKYIAEAQKIAALSAVLPQSANAILYRSAVKNYSWIWWLRSCSSGATGSTSTGNGIRIIP